MASSLRRIKTGAGATSMGRELIDVSEQFGRAFADLKRHFAAMVQMKDGDGTQASHFAVPAAIYAFTTDGTDIDNATAKASYDELNSLIGTHAAAIEQFCAQHKQ